MNQDEWRENTINAMASFCLNEMQEIFPLFGRNSGESKVERGRERQWTRKTITGFYAPCGNKKIYAINMATSKRYFYLCTEPARAKQKLLRVGEGRHSRWYVIMWNVPSYFYLSEWVPTAYAIEEFVMIRNLCVGASYCSATRNNTVFRNTRIMNDSFNRLLLFIASNTHNFYVLRLQCVYRVLLLY